MAYTLDSAIVKLDSSNTIKRRKTWIICIYNIDMNCDSAYGMDYMFGYHPFNLSKQWLGCVQLCKW